MKPRNTRARVALATGLLGLGLAACGGTGNESSEGGDGSGGSVSLVAYSTPQTAYEETIQPAFNESPEGEGVQFSNSFGGSGDQSRAVEAGQPADLVHFALETDVTRLVDAGIVAEDWKDQGDYNGIVQNSVVAFTVRTGNPLGIESWQDLIEKEAEIVTPNPFTSGGARWNIMAAYGSVLTNGGSEEEALDFVRQILTNTVSQDKSASDALGTFTGGTGDVLLSYENEAIRAIDAGEDVEYVIPDDTILIETPVAIPEDAQDPDAAQRFLDFLYSPEGQQLFADAGYRPVDQDVLAENEDVYPAPANLFTIEEFGGWDTVATEFFDSETGSVAEIERDLGVSTG